MLLMRSIKLYTPTEHPVSTKKDDFDGAQFVAL